MITTQPRLTFAPMAPRVLEVASAVMLRKIISYINGSQERSAASGKRVYRVYK